MIKKITTWKAFFQVTLLSLVIAFSSCKQQSAEDTKDVAEEATEENLEAKDSVTDVREKDSDYLIAAAETDMMEIELGKLAMTKSTNASVKDLGKMMIDQHTTASEKLKPLAASKQVVLPMGLTDKGKENYEDLNKKSGKDFDEAYTDLMVDGHEDAISKMKDASEDAEDAEVRQWAAAMLPVLNTHLQHAKTIKDQIKKTK